MTRPPDDPPPPSVPPAPDFDLAAPDVEPGLTFDTPAPIEPPSRSHASAPWYQGTGTLVAGALIVVAVLAIVVSRLSAPEPAAPAAAAPVAPPPPAAAAGPLEVVPLADEVIGEQAPPPNVTAARPGFLPEGVPLAEVAGREASGTVTRPDGAWLRVTLEPGVYTFRVAAGADTELHLYDVFTELAVNDDTDGLNPAVTERLIGGDYYLWLHIHDEAADTTAPFTLAVDGPA